MDIRLEDEKDYREVENLVRDAFWNVYRPGAFEHYIVHNLRDDESFISDLAYVIEKDNRIIGHINYSYGNISPQNCDAVVLGPIAIDKEFQNRGYGTRLIEYTMNLIEAKGIPYVFVIGDENYYGRFGFVSASGYGIYLEGTDASEENPFFMIKVFGRDKIDFNDSMLSISDVFDVDEKCVDEFDKKFEYKEKKVIEGQLE